MGHVQWRPHPMLLLLCKYCCCCCCCCCCKRCWLLLLLQLDECGVTGAASIMGAWGLRGLPGNSKPAGCSNMGTAGLYNCICTRHDPALWPAWDVAPAADGTAHRMALLHLSCILQRVVLGCRKSLGTFEDAGVAAADDGGVAAVHAAADQAQKPGRSNQAPHCCPALLLRPAAVLFPTASDHFHCACTMDVRPIASNARACVNCSTVLLSTTRKCHLQSRIEGRSL